MSTDLVFRILAETSDLDASVKRSSDTLGKLPAATTSASRGFAEMARGGKLSADQMRQLSFQTNDFFVQVASGQSPMTALIQQGSQLTSTFGGVGGALRAVGSLFTLTNVAIGAGVAAVGGLGMAYLQAQERQRDFQRYIVLTGNSAGVTAGQIDAMAQSIATDTRVSTGTARELIKAYMDTGSVGPEALESVARATARLAQITGKSSEEVRKEFNGLFDNPAQAALRLNKQHGFLTASTAKLIVKLQEQGKEEAAGKIVADEFNRVMKARTGTIDEQVGAWGRLKTMMANGWNTLVGSVGEQTLEHRIEMARREVIQQSRRPKGSTGSVAIDQANAQEELRLLLRSQAAQQQAARRAALANNAATDEANDLLGKAGKGGGKPEFAYAIRDPRADTKQAFLRSEIEGREATDKFVRDAKERADAARARELDADIEAYRKRSEAGAQFGQQVADQTDAMNADLIQDAESRGRALIAIEQTQMTARLEALNLEGEEYSRIWNEIQSYVAARNRQLTEELKPEWQRQLEAWRDTNALMRNSFNEFQSGWLREGESAWISFMQTGKFSTKSLVDFMVAELARLQFRQQLAGGWSSIGQALGSWLTGSGGGFGTGSGYGNQDMGQYFAKGGVFGQRGELQAFAQGGVVDRATHFNFASGGSSRRGVMGEAGPEAVMPLTRTANGKLGVMAQGGASAAPVLNVHISNQASDVVQATAQQGSDGKLEVMIRRVGQAIGSDVAANRGPVARGMRARGVNLSGSLPRVG